MSRQPATAAPDSASVRAFEALKDRIVRWEYPPGYHLRERQLCDEFAISRVPVREALSGLDRLGLIEKIPNRGCFVKQPNLEELNHIYDMRVALETFVVTSLAQHGGLSPEVFAALWNDWDPQTVLSNPAQAAVRLDTLIQLDITFHLSLVRALGNPYIEEAIEEIDGRLLIVRKLDISDFSRLEATCMEHRAILTAIRQQDAAAARHHLASNINGAREKVEQSILLAMNQAYRWRV